MSEGNSKIDYTKVFAKKKLLVNKNDLISNLPDDIRNELQLGIIQPTDFGRRNNIVTSEWSFIREIIDINDFTINMAKALKDSLLKEIHPDGSRGRVIYLYCNNETYSRIDEVISILNQLNYDEIPILIGLLCDNDRVIEDALINLRTLNTFTLLEKELFRKYFRETIMEENKRIIRTYMACAKQKQYVTSKGVRVADEIVQKEMVSKFNMIYNKTIPFSIDSFDKKIAKKARRYFNTIAKCLLDGKLEDIVEFKNLEIDYINRINSILSVDSEKGWKVLYPNNVIGEPLHPVVKEIYTEIKQQILLKQPIKINELLGKYTKAPYGLNIYSITLLIVYVIALNKDNLIIKKGLAKSRISDILMCFNNDDKEQFNEFAKFIIEYTDITEKDNVVLLVEKIEKNIGIAIDQVDSLYNEISQIDELDVTQELKGRFFNCKNNLLIAREKNKEINKKIEDANTYLSKLDKNPFYIRQILTICNPIIDGVIQGSTYRYSVEQVTKSAQVREQAFIIFKNSIKIYGEKCPLDNLNNIDNMYKNTSIQLPKLNAIELVELVKESHEIFKNRIKLKNLASEVCIEINKEISNIKIDIELVRNLTNCKKTINKWLEKRNEYEKLNSNELNNVYKQLEDLETKIDIIERNTNQILADAKEIIHSVTTLSDLSNCLGKISNLLDMPMLEDTKNSLKVIYDSLKDIDNQLQIFRYKKYTRIEITEVITKISDGNSNLTDLISKIKVNLLENLDLQDKEWKNKFIDKYTDLDSISINELKEIKNKASKDKEFLSDENKILLEDLNRKIESILNKYKIENILSIFNELNSEDRKTCIDKLKTMV